jgi:hypothetical protein
MSQNTPEDAPESTETAPQPDSDHTPAPDVDTAGEALVQQIAEAIESQCLGLASGGYDWTDAARAVLPLVEAQVAYHRDIEAAGWRSRAEDAEARVAPLRDEAARLNGAWRRSDKAANEALRHVASLTRALAEKPYQSDVDSETARADAAESALRQVREDLTALAERLEAEPFVGGATERAARDIRAMLPIGTYHTPGWPCGGQIKCPACCANNHGPTCNPDRGYCTCGADGMPRVGAADTQPEGAGDEKRFLRYQAAVHSAYDSDTEVSEQEWDDRVVRAVMAVADQERATPTAGGKVDTAPEAGKCWRHDYGHREYVCRCDPPREGDTGMDPADTAPESGEGR